VLKAGIRLHQAREMYNGCQAREIVTGPKRGETVVTQVQDFSFRADWLKERNLFSDWSKHDTSHYSRELLE